MNRYEFYKELTNDQAKIIAQYLIQNFKAELVAENIKKIWSRIFDSDDEAFYKNWKPFKQGFISSNNFIEFFKKALNFDPIETFNYFNPDWIENMQSLKTLNLINVPIQNEKQMIFKGENLYSNDLNLFSRKFWKSNNLNQQFKNWYIDVEFNVNLLEAIEKRVFYSIQLCNFAENIYILNNGVYKPYKKDYTIYLPFSIDELFNKAWINYSFLRPSDYISEIKFENKDVNFENEICYKKLKSRIADKHSNWRKYNLVFIDGYNHELYVDDLLNSNATKWTPEVEYDFETTDFDINGKE